MTVVKVIGLVLLGIFLLILMLLLALLFLPVHYSAEGKYQEKTGRAEIFVHWFLALISFRGEYGEEGLRYRLKIFGISLLTSEPDKEKQKKKPAKKPLKRGKKEKKGDRQDVSVKNKIEDRSSLTAKEKRTEKISFTSENYRAKTDDVHQHVEKEEKQKEQRKEQKKKEPKNEKKTSLKDESILQEITQKIENWENWKNSSEGEEFFTQIRNNGGRLLTHLAPRTLSIQGTLGFSDPATTGKILALVYMLYPLYGDHIHLVGEFEHEIISGEAKIKGFIQIYVLLSIAISLYRNKTIHQWIHQEEN